MTETNIEKRIEGANDILLKVINEVHKKVIWQDALIKSLIVWLLADGHILLEWVPWVAKTLTIDTLANTLNLDFKRVQFTPDLLPSDLVWTEIYNVGKWEFQIKKWPIFTNFLLADEINRAPSKVQSALLESMAEKHVTIWDETFNLDLPFIVLATQNPIEQSGTYKLPEAELDRFMLKAYVDYPTMEEEKVIASKIDDIEEVKIKKQINKKDILELRELVKDIHVSENIIDYISDLVFATRDPIKYWLEYIKIYLKYWVSPRWTISLIKWAKAIALLNNRSFVIPEDVKEIAVSALSHRLVMTYDAIADEIKAEDIIIKIINKVKVR